MFRLVMVILFLISMGFSQQPQKVDQSEPTEGESIIRKASQAIGLDKKGQVSSGFYKVKTTYLDNNPKGNFEIIEEIRFTLPDKIQTIFTVAEPLSSQSTKTWNGNRYKSILESSYKGQRIVKDDTNQENTALSKNVSKVLGKETTSGFRRPDPKESLKETLWTDLFPLILMHPLESKPEFKYVGKARSNEKTANVIDVKASNGRTYRLFFDAQTNYLIMLVVSFKVDDQVFVGDVELKYYYSNREEVDGILIPKTIKVENRQTAVGQAPKIQFLSIEVIDFKLNPEFKKDLFEIK